MAAGTKRIIRIGTRASPLALEQAYETRRRLGAAHGLNEAQMEIVKIISTGDKIQDKALREFGGKGLFTKEIEEALGEGRIDIAVHSMKDMPTALPRGLVIDCLLPREDVRDAFLSHKAARLSELPQGAIVGSSSLRRQAQIKHLRPDLEVITYRGNVQTRLKKLHEGVADATLLACAGLRRLGYSDKITSLIETDEMLPAVAQGAIGIERRADDEEMAGLLAPLNDGPTSLRLAAERAFLKQLDGSCRTPIAGLAELFGDEIIFRGQILSPDGSRHYETSRRGPSGEAAQIGSAAARELIERAGPEFIASLT